MTPLEKAKVAEGRVNYCDECEQFEIVGNAAYCKVDGKLIHPIMLMRGQGTGAAWNCKKRRKPLTNYDSIIRKTPDELALWLSDIAEWLPHYAGKAHAILKWLEQEATE